MTHHTIAAMKASLKSKGVSGYSGKSKAELHRMCEHHRCMPDPPKFIQKVMSAPGYRKGAMTKKAKAHGEKPLEYAKEVLAHPGKHDLRTRRQAQFLVNIQKK